MSASATRPPRPLAVLFACGQNSVRSPIAAGLFKQMFGPSTYVSSAGVRKGELDPFAVAVMAEARPRHLEAQARHLRGARRMGGSQFRSHHHAGAGGTSPGDGIDPHERRRCRVLADGRSDRVEGSRAQRLDAYREIRDQLMERIRQRFSRPSSGNE